MHLLISTHDLARRSTHSKATFRRSSVVFQLTTSQGGRPQSIMIRHLIRWISTHDLARRSTQEGSKRDLRRKYFNSRPRKEVDQNACKAYQHGHISTHDLARRSTHKKGVHMLEYTFQLTTSQGGRPSSCLPMQGFPIFQLTTSQGGRREEEFDEDWKKIFQLTTSQGGRLCFCLSFSICI